MARGETPSLIAELERATHSGSKTCAETLRRVTDLFLAGADRFTEDQVLLFEDVLGFLIAKDRDTGARGALDAAGAGRATLRSG